MIKKILAAGMCAVIVLSFTGCGNNITLTKEQNDLVAEYVAGVMLKNSYDNKWKYQKLKLAKDTYIQKGSSNTVAAGTGSTTGTSAGTTAGTAAGGSSGLNTSGLNQSDSVASGVSAGNSAGSNATVSGDTMTDIKNAMGLKDATISYSKYSVGDRYPMDEFAISVPASSGCKVIAVEFTITNTSAADIEVNSAASGLHFKMSVNGEAELVQQTAMLKNDITGLSQVTIPAGQTFTAVTLFQVTESVADNITGINLGVYMNNTSLGKINVL